MHNGYKLCCGLMYVRPSVCYTYTPVLYRHSYTTTSHRASASICWHFAFAATRLQCRPICLSLHTRVFSHSNQTRALIANPPNSAQLEGTPTIPPSYIRVRAVVGMRRETDTHTDTDRRAWPIYISRESPSNQCWPSLKSITESGHANVRETSVRESDCPGNVRYP